MIYVVYGMPRFQSTPSVGRATIKSGVDDIKHKQISIHALRGEGDLSISIKRFSGVTISIHALRGEGDLCFYHVLASNAISIHALRGEGDALEQLRRDAQTAFQSTPSVGRATEASM